jgi:hypothetical protein
MRKSRFPWFLNALPALGLVIVFIWAAWERFRLPLTPFAVPDVWAYLGPGLGALVGDRFHEWQGQCFLYPGFLYAVLRFAGSLHAITLIQAFFGLGTGALMFACWMELRHFMPRARLPTLGFKVLGVALSSVYLFSTATVEFEHTLRPEAVFPFVVVLQIYCNLRFIRAFFHQRQPSTAVVAGGLAVFLSVTASLLKPSFSGVLLFANLPVIISLFHKEEPLRSKLLFLGLPLCAAAFLLIGPEWRLRGSTHSVYLAQSLFSIHGDLIDKQIAQDLARHVHTRYSPEFLALTHLSLGQALVESRRDIRAKWWPALGFCGDYLRIPGPGKRSFLSELSDRLGGEEQSGEFCRYYYWRTVRGQAGGMAAKIGRQFAVFYHFGRCPAYSTYESFDVGKEYVQTAESLIAQPKLRRYPAAVALLADSTELTQSHLQIGPYRLSDRIRAFLSKTHLYWCLWALLLVIGACTMKPVNAVFGRVAPVLLLLSTYSFGTVLTLAIGHSLDVSRYSRYQYAFTLLPDFVAVWLALEGAILVAKHAKEKALGLRIGGER